MEHIEKEVGDLKTRVSVVETKVEFQSHSIEKVEKKLEQMDQKIDKLIELSSWSRMKHGMMYGSLGSGVLGLVHLVMSHLSK